MGWIQTALTSNFQNWTLTEKVVRLMIQLKHS
jgi:hypothetical protein